MYCTPCAHPSISWWCCFSFTRSFARSHCRLPESCFFTSTIHHFLLNFSHVCRMVAVTVAAAVAAVTTIKYAHWLRKSERTERMREHSASKWNWQCIIITRTYSNWGIIMIILIGNNLILSFSFTGFLLKPFSRSSTNRTSVGVVSYWCSICSFLHFS